MQERYIVPKEVVIPQESHTVQQAVDVLADIGKREINKTKTSMEICQCYQCHVKYRDTQLWWDGPFYRTQRGEGTLFTRWEQQRKIDEAG